MNVEGVPLPPAELIFMNSSAEDGLQQGIAQVRKLDRVGVDTRDGLVFDIGCGYGRLAYGLLASGFAGEYLGVDITAERIGWLQQNFTPAQPRYRFAHEDVRNDLYNPKGGKAQPGYDAVLGDRRPDTIILLSVFTHMYEDDIRNHLARIVRAMSDDTVLFFSCFLFDGPAAEGIAEGKARRAFAHRLSDHCRYDRKGQPLAAIAFTEPFMVSLVQEAGLEARVHRGTWTGMPTAEDAFAQDVLVCRRRAG